MIDNPNIGYLFGFVESFLESLVVKGDTIVPEVLEHFKVIEIRYKELFATFEMQKDRLARVQREIDV